MVFSALLAGAVMGAQTRLEIEAALGGGGVRLQGWSATNQVFTLQASSNLVDWEEMAVLYDRPTDSNGQTDSAFSFQDLAAPNFARRFYRCMTSALTPGHDWKNAISFPNDSLLSPAHPSADGIRWVKCAVLRNEPYRVYYQDSAKYPFHYDFAVARLGQFRGLSREAFDLVSLRSANQQVILGTVLFPPAPVSASTPGFPEFGIQLVGLDPYPREQVQRLLELVKSTVWVPPGVVPLYFPTFEQTDSAIANADFFASKGMAVSSVNRWLRGDVVYSTGWAIGRLVFVPADAIRAAYTEGRLHPQDVLLTDGVPTELPFVAGILTLAPATPSSHAAILARSYAVPFAFLATLDSRARVQELAGKEILLQSTGAPGLNPVTMIELENNLGPATKAGLLALKRPAAAEIAPRAKFGAYWVSADRLVPSDIQFFGGKAADFGFLRRTIPSNSPSAIAFSFDLWDAFLDQTLPGGKTLRAAIHDRLSPHTYPPDLPALMADLATVRALITQTARFEAPLRQAVTKALVAFDPLRKIRFRSSSNAEDTETFSAAGLYDSYSGCLADDLDGDDSGPCRCDLSEARERGVFRAIQKVYAGFYNDNAFLERLRHGIKESEVGMALLVHHSTPDDQEMANGVATVKVAVVGSDVCLSVDLVTQAGAVSVTNPKAAPNRKLSRLRSTPVRGPAVLSDP